MFYSLKSRLIAIFILLFVLSFGALSAVLFNESRSIILSQLESSALEKMEEYGSYVDMVQMGVYDVASLVFNNETTRDWDDRLGEEGLPTGEKILSNLEMSTFLTQATNSYTSVQRVTVYRDDGLWVSGENQFGEDATFLGESWYRDFKGKGERWVAGHVDLVERRFNNDNPVVSMIMPIAEFEPRHASAFMKINVSTDYFLEPLDRIHLGVTGSIHLLGSNGLPMLGQEGFEPTEERTELVRTLKQDSRKQGVIHSDNSSGQREIIVFKKLKRTNWMLVGIVPESDLYAELFDLRQSMIAIATLVLLLSVGLAIWLSHSISKPLSRLVAAMRHVQRGDFAQAELRMPPEVGLRNEVGFATSTFRKMVVQLRQHIKTEFELKLLRQQAEYKALLMQINPHFLFNTLELMSSLAMQKRTDDNVDVIESLGRMMRFSLRMSDDIVSLGDELKYAGDYASILRVRFGDRLHLSIDKMEGLERHTVIKFILQPLIENAVKYGFRHGTEVYVDVRAERAEGHIRLVVEDNGPGIPEETINELRDKTLSARMEDVLVSKSKQIGLGNVLARCGLYYGDLFRFHIGTSELGGASIALLIPIQEELSDVQRDDRG
ncbi:two-component sensor histidine kinase [Paenibacillus agaridevorans]|uniref:histidine kinase n=1 Tax=Paenibacillus agaridevorans TaxID=171404 RepID=A0A2R5EPR2_9BACL|nr:sensor histidine kinase [Paenibacillus agaridevorans]GBG08696.1 two-component sensor histidine kinase [Paenibacillus agaridevorans]